MNDLDAPGTLALDASDMLGHVARLGDELERAWAAAEEIELPEGAANATGVVIAAIGGSATAGDYFAALCEDSAEIPVVVVRGPSLPYWVGEGTLVVASSYSGNTSETLAAYDDAWKRDAMLLAVTTGGTLAERAQSDSVPVHVIDYASPPRAALAHGLAPLLRLGAAMGLCMAGEAEVAAAARAHRELVRDRIGPGVPAAENGAKRLAGELQGRAPFIVAGQHLKPVAGRFKNQLAENGKSLAAAESLPEAAHNLVVGLDGARECPATVVLLESRRLYEPALQAQFEAFAGQCDDAGVPAHRITARGATVLEDLLLGTAWADTVSCYAGLLRGIDPTPISRIERLRGLA